MLRTLGKSKFIFLSFHNYAAQNYNKYLIYANNENGKSDRIFIAFCNALIISGIGSV